MTDMRRTESGSMKVRTVFVVGAGTMGNGIAQVVAEAGHMVTMEDVSQDIIEKALDTIDRSLSRKVKKGTISEDDRQGTQSRIRTATSMDGASDADLVIEAVPEDLRLKLETFSALDSICSEGTILASNTSAFPISAIAAATRRQSHVIGIHFMNPAPVMRGVEIIRGRRTSDETFNRSKDFVEGLGKEPCEAVDYAGFIVSRILDAMQNEAICCVMDGNRPEEVDRAMRMCANFPMGPLELCDLVGADILLHGLQTLHGEFGDRLRPAPLLLSMVRAGDLGRKTGRGFYDYSRKA